jgi:hypothetical protein
MSVAGGHESVGVGLQDLAPDEQGEGTDFQIGQRGHLIIDINDVGVAGKSAMEVARIPVEGYASGRAYWKRSQWPSHE